MSHEPPNDQPAADALTVLQQRGTTRHGGNIGETPFYLQPGQCEPEYDQGHWVIVWYDDLVLKQEDLDKASQRAEAAEQRVKDVEQEREQERVAWELRGGKLALQLEAAEATIASLRTLSAAWRSAVGTNRTISFVSDYLEAMERCAGELDRALAEGTAVPDPPASATDEDALTRRETSGC